MDSARPVSRFGVLHHRLRTFETVPVLRSYEGWHLVLTCEAFTRTVWLRSVTFLAVAAALAVGWPRWWSWRLRYAGYRPSKPH
jgi:hypothetical protein